jgi:hypothetical protein
MLHIFHTPSNGICRVKYRHIFMWRTKYEWYSAIILGRDFRFNLNIMLSSRGLKFASRFLSKENRPGCLKKSCLHKIVGKNFPDI